MAFGTRGSAEARAVPYGTRMVEAFLVKILLKICKCVKSSGYFLRLYNSQVGGKLSRPLFVPTGYDDRSIDVIIIY